jgi:TolB-like protein/Tfp pilus assembly protein PilF
VRFLFSNHVFDTARRELSCDDREVPIEPQVFDLLNYLLEHRDRVVSKDDLIEAVWCGRIVSDSTLTSRINAARKAVGDSGSEQKLIRTVPRKGFRFVGSVVPGKTLPEVAAGRVVQLAPQSSELPLPDRPAIAVLPFINMSDDREQDYFSDGISEDLITALSKLRWFFVIARNSSFTYKGRAVHISEVARELGVRYVVEGSVRKSGDQVRISVQLNDASTGGHIWAERYDRNLAGVFAVQDEITESIVGAIEPQLYAAENFRAQSKPPGSLDAWDLVMRALSYFWRITRQDNVVAQALLEKAIAIDPQYGQALGLLATSHIFGAHMGWADMRAAVPIAEPAALAAVEADPEDAWAHLGLAYAYLFARRFDDSIAEFELALRMNPNFALAQAVYGVALCYSGRWQDGDRAARRALRLSPRAPSLTMYYGTASHAQFVGRNYDEAIRLARESLRHRPDFVGGHRVLTAAAGMAGYREIAKAALPELRRAQPTISLAWIASELPLRRCSDREHFLEGFRRAGLT